MQNNQAFDMDLDSLLAQAEAARAGFDSGYDGATVCQAALPAMPTAPTAPRGRPVFTDPTDPNQIHAIATRCKAHYIPCQGQWVHITKKEAKAFAKALKLQGNPVVAQLSEDGATLYFG